LINEVYNADPEVQLRSAEASALLKLYRAEKSGGKPVTIAMLSADVMRLYGAFLVVLEEQTAGEFTILYAGSKVPDDRGESLAAKSTLTIEAHAAAFFKLGCMEAKAAQNAICILHLTGPEAPVHRWECLFLPMDDAEGQNGNPIYVALCVPREHKGAFLLSMLDASPEASIMATPIRAANHDISDATIIYANQRAAELTGMPEGASLLNASLCGLFDDAGNSGGWSRYMMSALRTGKAQSFEYHHRNDTFSRWLRVTAVPVKDGILASFSDITESKRAMLELEHQKKMLMDEMEQRRGLEQELWALAHLDPLTTLPNRRAFRDAARIKLAEAQSANRPCALVSLDIDHFKHINDAYGHGAGDMVLRRIADIIKAPLRPNTDMGARMGGEEFSIILPDTDIDSAIAFAEKLRKRIEQTIVVSGENEIRPTMSLGIAMNRKSTNLDDLLERADRALYTAKRSGRNKVATEAEGPPIVEKEAAA